MNSLVARIENKIYTKIILRNIPTLNDDALSTELSRIIFNTARKFLTDRLVPPQRFEFMFPPRWTVQPSTNDRFTKNGYPFLEPRPRVKRKNLNIYSTLHKSPMVSWLG